MFPYGLGESEVSLPELGAGECPCIQRAPLGSVAPADMLLALSLATFFSPSALETTLCSFGAVEIVPSTEHIAL